MQHFVKESTLSESHENCPSCLEVRFTGKFQIRFYEGPVELPTWSDTIIKVSKSSFILYSLQFEKFKFP